ncbi:hypothetical protein CCUS01_12227 [Colletotrichum cuscutae]|uniref:Uncharacterized protein n=1 Tax=Colletotrichum cuscutae TaxID=1209917 RepID=A0AAI9TVK6_9PEZI|nr:hypothetical protein CCUS01_12227 [Colletotrichum cuscutae]
MSTPTLCIAPALQVAPPGLAIFFLDAPAQHIHFRSHFRPFSPTPSSYLQVRSSRFFPFCVHFHVRPPGPSFSSYPHAPSLPLPSPLSTLPTSHRFLPPNPSFPPTSHSHDSDPLLIRSSKGAEDSRS